MQKNSLRQLVKALIAGAFISTLVACGGGGVSSSPPAAKNKVNDNSTVIPNGVTYTVGGTVKGLPTAGLPSKYPLKLSNGAEVLSIEKDGTFIFPTAIGPGMPYKVAVKTNPIWALCDVNNAEGSSDTDVTDVDVVCADAEKGKVTTLDKTSLPAKPLRVAVTSFGYYFVVTENNEMVRYYTDLQGVVRYEYYSGLHC